MKDFHFIDSMSVQQLEELYQTYQQQPDQLEESWKNFFRGFEFAQLPDIALASPYVDIPSPYEQSPAAASSSVVAANSGESPVIDLIEAHRKRGHLCATNNPLSDQALETYATLDKSNWGLTEQDLERRFEFGSEMGVKDPSLRNIIEHLKKTYCSNIGVEFKYIRDPELVRWLQKRMEPIQNRHNFTAEEKKEIYTDLVRAEGFESFLNTKYVGKKRFSLEGGTALIPALESLLDYSGSHGAKEFVIGMAHRGRLNVMANVMRKKYDEMFTEFEGGFLPDHVAGDGDVKYHLGYSSDRKTASGAEVHLSLCPNPSHLEFISPVLLGITRSKQDMRYNKDVDSVIPIKIHGDAAFAGQGVVYETVNMSQLEGYRVGGCIHIVINNQVGFTTNPEDARSTVYCTDLMKMVETPIFHVNGDDPEAVVHCMHMALEFRQKFHRDVVIDLLCYRKYGHNEGEEPRFTQPKMYEVIDKKKSPAEIYKEKLIQEGVLSEEDAKKILNDFKSQLNEHLEKARETKPDIKVNTLQDAWGGLKVPSQQDIFQAKETGVPNTELKKIAETISTPPDSFTPVKRFNRLIKDRAAMASGEKAIDWGMSENLCYGSLLLQGIPVRITGQDVKRGTFSHRHAVWYDQTNGKELILLNHLQEDQAFIEIYNSHLSETGVMGFEFGYSMANPKALTIWEAQFGDFANGGQVIIDQFIAGSESKWQRMSGLVLLLPHGYEGQGPEHSSARLERFLQLAAENNIQVANLTRPDQLFHCLRRQVLRDFRRPLVIMSPKSLLRHPKVVCNFADLEKGSFQEVLSDELSPVKVERVVFCSGKVYYDLLAKRDEKALDKLAILRIEQLYPFPAEKIKELISQYSVNSDLVWLQEEPENMGAWFLIRDRFEKMGYKLRLISRKESASPATGSELIHKEEQEEILNRTMEGL